jgi:hypothetical protein
MGSNPILQSFLKREKAFWFEADEMARRSTRLMEIWSPGSLQP